MSNMFFMKLCGLGSYNALFGLSIILSNSSVLAILLEFLNDNGIPCLCSGSLCLEWIPILVFCSLDVLLLSIMEDLWNFRVCRKGKMEAKMETLPYDFIISKKPILTNRRFSLLAELLRFTVVFFYVLFVLRQLCQIQIRTGEVSFP